jgi:type IV pilus assembly protein PilE
VRLIPSFMVISDQRRICADKRQSRNFLSTRTLENRTAMRPTIPSRPQGFTLIELMVAVVIAGILAAVAYPSFLAFLQRGRRADAIAALSLVVQAQERWRSNSNTYAASLGADGLGLGDSLASTSRYYDFTLASIGEPAYAAGYQVKATPKTSGAQAGDAKDCAALIVKLDGSILKHLATGSGDRDTSDLCWPH